MREKANKKGTKLEYLQRLNEKETWNKIICFYQNSIYIILQYCFKYFCKMFNKHKHIIDKHVQFTEGKSNFYSAYITELAIL